MVNVEAMPSARELERLDTQEMRLEIEGQSIQSEFYPKQELNAFVKAVLTNRNMNQSNSNDLKSVFDGV